LLEVGAELVANLWRFSAWIVGGRKDSERPKYEKSKGKLGPTINMEP
jgi:hypothetical protein